MRMKVALIHDYLNQYGGAERILESIHNIFPDAPVYTLLYNPAMMHSKINSWDIRVSFLQKLPFIKKHYEKYLALFPLAIESFDLSDYDIVISDSSAWAKGVFTRAKTLHISYCYNPMRFAWEAFYSYTIGSHTKFARFFLRVLMNYLKIWDYTNSQRVNYVVAISHIVRERIKKYYRRDADIIFPPCNTDFFTYDKNVKKEAFYLIVSRFKYYKRIDIAVEAFNRLGLPLIIIGYGSEKGRLMRMAKKNVHFITNVEDDKVKEDEKIRWYYRRAQALIFPGIEDFGIVPVEAMATGTPVIAYGEGGLTDTVVAGKTGEFFYEQTPEALAEAVKNFKPEKFDPEILRKRALDFSRENFERRFKNYILEKYKNLKQKGVEV